MAKILLGLSGFDRIDAHFARRRALILGAVSLTWLNGCSGDESPGVEPSEVGTSAAMLSTGAASSSSTDPANRCEIRPPAGVLQPVIEWSWTSSPVESDALNVMSPPAVVDLDGDGTPDVVFGSTAATGGTPTMSGVLRALRGDTGVELFTVSDPALRINTTGPVAVGDIDRDGKVDILAQDESGTALIAFTNTGALKWRSPVLETSTVMGSPAIANLLGDSAPEIVIGRQVLDGRTGNVIWTGTAGRSGYGLGPHTIVADLDMDGVPEVSAGNTVYAADGTVRWTLPDLPDGFTAVANFDSDPYPEVVLAGLNTVYLLDHDGTVKWGPVPLPHFPGHKGAVHEGGPPVVADVDGDGEPEIGVAGSDRFAVFEADGTLKWEHPISDASSYRQGAAGFDFDGDGAAEILANDEYNLRVFGGDGKALFEIPWSSCTWGEYPVVADVDADGRAEFVAVANNNCGRGTLRGVFAYGAQGGDWASARTVWNQYGYHVTNVNEDGSIPAVERNNWAVNGLNTYRAQANGLGNPFAAPDLAAISLKAKDVGCWWTTTKLVAGMKNIGDNVAKGPIKVAFYDGDPTAGGALLGVVSTGGLDAGDSSTVTLSLSSSLSGAHDVCVVVDDDGTGTGSVDECIETNNRICTKVHLPSNGPVHHQHWIHWWR